MAIECDWRIRKLIRANLEAVGLTVGEAVSGPHGLELLRERRPDLILLNVDLPDVDALYLLGAFQAQLAGHPVPVIALCAEPPERRLLQHGQITSCLQKPFSASDLLRQVRQALNQAPIGG